MLREIRHGVSGFFAKILMVLLVISFGFWGIGDILTKTSPGNVAQVGGEEVTVAEFQRAIKDIRNTLGDQYSPELVKSLNLYQVKLSSLVNSKLLMQEARRLGISISDDAIIHYISKDKTFYNPNGNFDRGLFAQLIQQQGYSESEYIEALRRELASQIIIDTLTQKAAYPRPLLSLMYQAKHERREVTLIRLSEPSAAGVAEPTEAELSDYFKKHQDGYSAPEFRIIRYLIVDPQQVLKNVELSREELMEAYQQRASKLVRPEKRQVEQLLYGKKEQAEKAYEMLMAGSNVLTVAKEIPPINKDSIDLGLKAKGEIPTGEKEIFALNEGEFTKPIESPFGWHIFNVTKVQESKPMPFDEVKGMLEEELRQNKAEEELQRQVEKLEDAFSSGADLDSIASQLGGKVETTEPLNAEGKTPDNRVALDPARFANTLKAAFALKKGEASDILTENDGSSVALAIQEVTPARNKTFDEVRGQVVQDIKKETAARKFREDAKELAENLAKGKDVGLGSVHGATLSKGTLTREGVFSVPAAKSPLNLPDTLVSNTFSLTPQQPYSQAFAMEDGFAIAKLESITPAADPKKSKDAKRDYDALKRSLEQDYRDEVLMQYFNALRREYPVTVNTGILEALLHN